MIDTVTGICWGEGNPRDVAQRRVNEQIGLELTMEDRIDRYAIVLGITDYDSTNARSTPVLYRGVRKCLPKKR